MDCAVDTWLSVTCPEMTGRAQPCEPVTAGIPFPRGAVGETTCLTLSMEDGRPVPLQAVPSERWPDGSVRWALIDFQSSGRAGLRTYRLRSNGAPGAPAPPGLVATATRDRVDVDTGVARFRFRAGSTAIFDAAATGASGPEGVPLGHVTITDHRGRRWPARATRVVLDHNGPLRCAVDVHAAAGPRRRSLNVRVRLECFAGSAAVRIAVTIHNPRSARHTGGFWELGDHGSTFLRDASVEIALPKPATRVECAQELDASFAAFETPLEIYQDSSGGERWRHVTHQNREGRVPCRFRGYTLSAPGVRHEGLRATPALVAGEGRTRTAIAVQQFWQNFPKAIEARADALVLRLFPEQFGDLHELQGGEQKTHRFVLALGDDPLAADAVFWGRAPAPSSADPGWYCASGAIAHLSPAAADRDGRYARLVNPAVEGEETFERKRELVDEYGWRHFGDMYADHENPFSGAGEPIVSHYNNQYDSIGGCAAQFMRTGDHRWWRVMDELATHVSDIDIYHTDDDKAAYNHGLFWHTFHYVPAGRSTHRSYPRHPKVWGGGPANEHNYTAGLRLHWLLTGDPRSRDAAAGLARWVVAMDDGRKTSLRWLSGAPTGLASATQSPDFHGPGRGAGHSIMALLDGHRITGEAAWLACAETLITRCIHPGDDQEALQLLDAERRWSYVVFLQALGKYLEYKAELGQDDRASAYARAALLHYARWMAAREYPYLEKPEILEYPTETWAAQDMRKCEVFLFAAQHATGDFRARCLERATFFFDYSVSTLLASPTRTMARPLALLLSNGFMYLSPDAAGVAPAAPAAEVVVEPGAPFVTQKMAAKKRLMATAAVLAAIVLLAAIAAIL